jgi:hypothetical protein
MSPELTVTLLSGRAAHPIWIGFFPENRIEPAGDYDAYSTRTCRITVNSHAFDQITKGGYSVEVATLCAGGKFSL